MTTPAYFAVLIDKPPGWQPQSANDIPPGIDLNVSRNGGQVAAYALGHNVEEMRAPTGKWCVVVVGQL
jgi:hypothetical protein